ncbi:retinoid-inducible serine carboxypeptidase [Microplitis demolitor]|uniref:retinoid-inducible serine carboxypeptidase n=1 Tax=Microplitis demolitor TaxID=69319 RepID=UPI0004CD89EF|nr:retinoid-inducible serine carboxypeptidase [Microplitis demolitor]
MYWIRVTSLLLLFLLHVAESSEVGKVGFGPGKQDWGHVTVRPGAQMFWWLYYVNPPTINTLDSFNVFEKPLIIWLQGGPGEAGSGYGNFNEFGPLDLNLKRRNHTWVNDYNVLLIDNPVGVGFSFVANNSLMAKNNTQIAQDLVICIKKFLETIPEFGNVPTYIVGESYGGKMAVEFALLWSQAQKSGMIQSELKGIALGDSSISMSDIALSIPTYILNTGLIETKDFSKIQSFGALTAKFIKEKQWENARKSFNVFWYLIHNVTDHADVYNILRQKNSKTDNSHKYFSNYRSSWKEVDVSDQLQKLMESDVQKALGLNVTYRLYSEDVNNVLKNEILKPVTEIVEQLLNETDIKIFVCTGQLDMVIPTPGTLAWVNKLEWKHAETWRNTSRVSFTVDNIVEGYVKEYQNLKLYWINRSGHTVPSDNPFAFNAILQDLTSSENFNHVMNTN